MPSGNRRESLEDIQERKRLLILACAADRVELELLCRPGPPLPRMLAAALPQIWPLISLFSRLRHRGKKDGGKDGGGSWWSKIAEPLAMAADWIGQGAGQDQPRPPHRFES